MGAPDLGPPLRDGALRRRFRIGLAGAAGNPLRQSALVRGVGERPLLGRCPRREWMKRGDTQDI